jgi:4-amino-4-deoxy-L-arabinose transferase-like glycosyltransferase
MAATEVRPRVRRRIAYAALLAVAMLSIFPGLGSATFWEPDEPRFAEATRQMFERGDFVTPYLNGVPRFEKPILLYWLQAGSSLVLGTTELAARMPSAIAGVGCVLLIYFLTARMASERAGLVAAVALATMFRFVVFARQGLTDVPSLFFIVAAVYGFVRAASADSPKHVVWLAWAAVGLGVITKGPVGLLPLAIWGAYAAVGRQAALITRIRPIAGLTLASAIVAPWYLTMMLRHGRAFTNFAIGHEIVERVLSESSFAPVRGFTFYFQVWPGDAAPWSVMFVAALVWSAARWRSLDTGARESIVFALSWFLCVFALFSLSQSKIPHYVLPAYPAAAMLIGVFVDRLADSPSEARWWRVPMSLVAVVCLATALLLSQLMTVLMPDASPGSRLMVPMILGGGAMTMAVAVWRSMLLAATWCLAVTLSLTFAVIGAVFVPGTIERFKPMPRLAREAAQLVRPGEAIGLLGRYGASSVIYYSHHNVQWLLDDEEAVAFLSGPQDSVSVMPATDFARIAPRVSPPLQVIDTAEEFNVRLSRLIERQVTPGRQWVLVTRTRPH